ncbi:substrate-binding domain-containing protein [Myxococcus faecalis]|uniref:substrate-binding domain-containing protein n=1 Tax=Myxococcus faecalis TaxID=3115646 RepID=UPI0038CF838E
MNSMKWVMSATVVAMSVVGCGGQSVVGVQQAESSRGQALAQAFYGSDTLKDTFIAGALQAGSGLSVEGKGSGVGEACMRNGVGSSGFCGAGQQTLAPMSRDFAAPKTASGATCLGGTAADAKGCCPGERSNTIALDAVNAFVKTSTYTALASNGLTTQELRRIFFATDNANVAIPGACPTDWSAFGLPSAPIVKYRRDDLSGTTDTFKSLLKGGAFCPGVTVIVDESAANPSPCTASDSATACIGRLTEAGANAIGYAGDSASRPGNSKLKLKAVAPISPTTSVYVESNATNVRKLLQAGATDIYPLSRRLFLNENRNAARSFDEATLHEWIYDTNSEDFEAILTGQGFIACSDLGALDCGGDKGRGQGLCN